LRWKFRAKKSFSVRRFGEGEGMNFFCVFLAMNETQAEKKKDVQQKNMCKTGHTFFLQGKSRIF